VLCVALSPDTFLFAAAYLSRRDARTASGVYWLCNGIDDVSRVRDLGVGGLYVATQSPRPLGIKKLSWIFLDRKAKSGPKQLCGMWSPVVAGGMESQPWLSPIARISQR